MKNLKINDILFKKVKIDNKYYTFIYTDKQEKEFIEVVKRKDKDKAIEYMKLHFGYFVNIDYEKAYYSLVKQCYYWLL